MGGITGLASISIDCAAPRELAQFYARLLGVDVELEGDGYCSINFDGTWINFLEIPAFRPPTWPSGDAPSQVHLDFAVEDLDEAQQAAVAAGATLAEVQPEPTQWRVLLDPVGHPFCLTKNTAD